MDGDWHAEFDKAYQETSWVLNVLGIRGVRSKRVAEFRFIACETPMWKSISEEEGIVTIDPTKHEPCRVAHEMGHGLHECLRRDSPHLWHDDPKEGETLAETIRYFVEHRMNRSTSAPWLPRAEHSEILDACDYDLLSFAGMLAAKCTLDEVKRRKAVLEESKFDPMHQLMVAQVHRETIERARGELGRHVVLVFRKGGRIKEERRFDSESDSCDEVLAVASTMWLVRQKAPIGIDLIGKGFIGVLPWESPPSGCTFTEAERFNANCPVRVADVVEDTQTDTVTIYLESV